MTTAAGMVATSAIFTATGDTKETPWWESSVTWLTGTPLQLIAILVVALVTQVVLGWIIRRLVLRASERAKRERLEQTRKVTRTAELSVMLLTQRTEQRAAAIGSLLSSVVAITVWGIAGFALLQLLGIDIAPILASAGVIGVILGFGAQTLIKDYLSGIFIILEDQFGVGDIVDVGPVIGTVEEVDLRYTRLRDMSGVVWYVRNGEILRVGNRSQGWTLAIVDIPVDYNSDLNRVRDLIEKVAIDMDEDPTYDNMLLGQPMYAGVESMSGNAVVVRVTAKAVPEMQVQLVRTIRERIKLSFDRAGIIVPALPPQQMPPTPEPRRQ